MLELFYAMLAWASELWNVWNHPDAFSIMDKIIVRSGLSTQYNSCIADLTNNNGVLEHTFQARKAFIEAHLAGTLHGCNN